MVFCDVWKDERVERLKQLFDTNLRASEIAAKLNEEFGTSFSRLAILGKLHRLKLAYPKAAPRPKKPRVRKPSARSPNLPGSPFVPRIVDVLPRLVPFAELEARDCRYECTNADAASDWLFCGNPVKDGSSFCIKHHGICWMASHDKKVKIAA